ncbi:cytochrome b [Roseivivax sediminis]|uniref:Cytochrome b561 n=1 Tax=Roseivivax sediminis TaxID=936889 RepID=A0A1I2DJL3_9RHOB|nr:cytochrome b [Roseivivax sediminis]SFE80433.1 cytochrome b561 [Roseivivax sediminis]
MSITGYRRPARLFHWLVAALVLMMIPAGFVMIQEGLPRPVGNTLFIFHKNVGVIVFLLVVLRLTYRLTHPAPPLPGSVPDWQRTVSGLSHWALYALVLVMPVLGYVRVRAGGFPIEWLDALGVPAMVPKNEALAETAKALHFYGAWAITLLIGLHVAAALHHLILRRDGVFGRMWPPHGTQ